MRKFILKLILFFCLLIVADIALGGVFKLYDYTKGGEIGKIHSIMTKETPDLVVLGSSRATHHYVSEIIEDSLKVSAYNAGLDGQGIPIAYGFLSGLSQRKIPEYVVFEITPTFDLYDGFSPSLGNMFPYANLSQVNGLLVSFDNKASFKLHSNAYKLNSALFRLLPSMVKSKETINGYKPSYGQLDTLAISQESKSTFTVNTVKLKYLRKFIEVLQQNQCKVVFVISPSYGGADIETYMPEIEIIKSYNLPVLNHLNDTAFINNALLFSDKVHLNDTGAHLYTKCIVSELKNYLNISYNQNTKELR